MQSANTAADRLMAHRPFLLAALAGLLAAWGFAPSFTFLVIPVIGFALLIRLLIVTHLGIRTH